MKIDIHYYHGNYGFTPIGTLKEFINLCYRWEPVIEHLRNNSFVAELVFHGKKYFAAYTSGTEDSGLHVFVEEDGELRSVETSICNDEFVNAANNTEWYIVSVPAELEEKK